MSRELKILFAEPPPQRRIGGIETALVGLSHALAAECIAVTRADRLTKDLVANADVVHFHGLWETSHVRARRWCRDAGKPTIVSPHGMLEPWAFRHRGWKKRPYFWFVEKPSLAAADLLLATSTLEADRLAQWFARDRIRALPLGGDPAPVPNHADARRRLKLGDDEFVVLFLSRCHEKKGLHLLIAALPEATRAARRKVRLIVVGDGERSYVGPLQEQTFRWPGDAACTWQGACWDAAKWDYFSAADLFCLPSFSENFGLAVLEALFAGTPALTTFETPWPALRGALPISFTRANVPELTNALQARFAAPPSTAAERAATRAAAIASFAWSTLAPRYGELYRQLAAKS